MSNQVIDARALLVSSLRALTDTEMMHLLRERPDLLHPIPPDIERLAARAVSPSSVSRALDRINRSALQVAEALAVLPKPVSINQLATAMGSTTKSIPLSIKHAVAGLRKIGLIYGEDNNLLTPDSLVDVVGMYPCGLGGSASNHVEASVLAANPAKLKKLLATAPEEAQFIIEKLLWGIPVGKVADANRHITVETAKTPIEWLLAHGVIVATGPESIMLPREIALELREQKLFKELDPGAPEVTPDTSSKVEIANRAGGEIGYRLVRLAEQLLDAWSVTPPPVLRSGGLAARDLAKTAELLDVDEQTAALLVEICFAAGLIATDVYKEPAWAPTTAFDLWRIKDVSVKWESLILAWWHNSRALFLIGEKDEKGDRVNALQPGLDRVGLPIVDLRSLTIEALVFGSNNAEQIVDWIHWHRPRRDRKTIHKLVTATIYEAEFLGITGMGLLTNAGKQLLHHTEIAGYLAEFLPTPIDYIMIQADLTAIAPGPLQVDIERELNLIAEIESRSAATVYRFDEASIRKALDAGKTVDAVKKFLKKISKTEVPQPLTYLIEDTARKHGALRLGYAPTYLRSEDPGLLDALMKDVRVTALHPVRIAPTVVVFQADPEESAAILGQSGYIAMLESPDGTALIRARQKRRVALEGHANKLEHPSDEVLSSAVAALRQGDAAAPSARPKNAVRLTTAETVGVLREAVANKAKVWIGYANEAGREVEHVVQPIRLNAGKLTAFDQRSAKVGDFSIARITMIAIMSE